MQYWKINAISGFHHAAAVDIALIGWELLMPCSLYPTIKWIRICSTGTCNRYNLLHGISWRHETWVLMITRPSLYARDHQYISWRTTNSTKLQILRHLHLFTPSPKIVFAPLARFRVYGFKIGFVTEESWNYSSRHSRLFPSTISRVSTLFSFLCDIDTASATDEEIFSWYVEFSHEKNVYKLSRHTENTTAWGRCKSVLAFSAPFLKFCWMNTE